MNPPAGTNKRPEVKTLPTPGLRSLQLAEILDTLRGLLTPLIAVVAIYIAFQQYRTNRNRLRVELYDRRLAVYKALMEFLAKVDEEADAEISDLMQFRAETSEAFFLFGKKVPQYLDRVYVRAVELRRTTRRLNRVAKGEELAVDEDHKELVERNDAAVYWLSLQTVQGRKVFEQYLRLQD